MSSSRTAIPPTASAFCRCSTATSPVLARRRGRDGGYASRANLAAAKDRGVIDVAFHKKCGIAVVDMVKSPGVYRRLRNFRAGIEAAISWFKRAYGLRRRPLHLAGSGSFQGLHLVCRGCLQLGAVRPTQTSLAAQPATSPQP